MAQFNVEAGDYTTMAQSNIEARDKESNILARIVVYAEETDSLSGESFPCLPEVSLLLVVVHKS